MKNFNDEEQNDSLIELNEFQKQFLITCLESVARNSYPYMYGLKFNKPYLIFDDIALEIAKLLGANKEQLETIERGM